MRLKNKFAARARLAAGVIVVATMVAACKEEKIAAAEEAPTVRDTQTNGDDGFLSTMTAALSEGQVTLNMPWTQADLDYEDIGESIRYGGANARPEQVRPYTTLVQQYRARRKQCTEDARILNAEGEPSCYPTLVEGTFNGAAGRYGYYCGAGYPAELGAFWNQTPEPIDGVDYCCRLHDQETWGDGSLTNRSNECGIAMCLSKARGSPANVMALMPAVEAARQYWYDGAALACGGNQSDNALPPILGP